MTRDLDEERLLRSVALQNARAVLRAQEKAEAELHRVNRRITNILESIKDGFVVLDREFRFVYLNDQAIEYMRPAGVTSKEQLVGHVLWEVFPQTVDTPAADQYRRAMETLEPQHFEAYSAISQKWFQLRVYPSTEGLSIYYQDITHQREVEEQLRQQRIRLQAIFDHAAVGICTADHEGRLVEVNDKLCRILGYSADELIGRTFASLTFADDLTLTKRAFSRLRDGEATGLDHEKRFVRKDGSVVWTHTSATVVQDEGGRPLRYIGVIEDISERKRVEDQQRRSEEQLRALADSMPNLAWIAHPDGDIFWYNRGWYEYTGMRPEDMEDSGWAKVHDPAILESVRTRWTHSIQFGEPFDMEFPLRGADGLFRWFLTRANPVRDGEGRIVRWFGTNTNVDDVRKAREALREESRILELLNDTGSKIAANLDLQAIVQTVTDAATKLTGADFGAFFYNATNHEGEVLTLYTLSGAPKSAFDKFGHPRATALFGPTFRGEGVIRSPDILQDPRYGQWAPHHGMPPKHLPVRSYLAVPVIARSGEVIGGLFFGHKQPDIFTERSEKLVVGVAAQAAIAIDNARLFDAAQAEINERTKVEQALRTAQEELAHHAVNLESQVSERTASLREALAQLEEFSYTVSHDLRAPIRAIAGYAQIFREDHAAELTPDAQWLLERIGNSADHMARLVDDVLTLSRAASVEVSLHPIELMPFIEAIMDRHPSMQAPDAYITVDAPVTVVADDALLAQALTNLLSNAVKFVPRGTIPKVRVTAERTGGHVRILIEDNGVGIRAEHRDKLFGMFQRLPTTLEYEGTGIGLALVRKAVERMGGTVGSEPASVGSRFWIELEGR